MSSLFWSWSSPVALFFSFETGPSNTRPTNTKFRLILAMHMQWPTTTSFWQVAFDIFVSVEPKVDFAWHQLASLQISFWWKHPIDMSHVCATRLPLALHMCVPQDGNTQLTYHVTCVCHKTIAYLLTCSSHYRNCYVLCNFIIVAFIL